MNEARTFPKQSKYMIVPHSSVGKYNINEKLSLTLIQKFRVKSKFVFTTDSMRWSRYKIHKNFIGLLLLLCEIPMASVKSLASQNGEQFMQSTICIPRTLRSKCSAMKMFKSHPSK